VLDGTQRCVQQDHGQNDDRTLHFSEKCGDDGRNIQDDDQEIFELVNEYGAGALAVFLLQLIKSVYFPLQPDFFI